MPRAIRFAEFGDVDVLEVVEVDRPAVDPGRVLVEVLAAATNPGEIAIRKGLMEEMFPTTLPCGQGSDFAGRVVDVGETASGFDVGDEVIGYSLERSAQADYVSVPAEQLIIKPAPLDWPVAGSLYVVGATAYAAVDAVTPTAGEVLVVSNAGGGVGSLVVQLGILAGARVIGIAGADNADYLRSLGADHVEYGDGLADRLRERAPDGIDAFVDTRGGGYVDLAVELGVDPARIETIIDFEAAGRHGTRASGSTDASSADVLASMAELVADGRLSIRIGRSYPLEEVREAYTALEQQSVKGKIVFLLR